MFINQINHTLAALAIIGQAFIVVSLVYLIFFRQRQLKFFKFVANQALPLSFAVALIATLGSLYYSEIAGFNPCKLCWFQRVLIYPQVILFGLAWWKKDNHAVDYGLAMVAVGTLVSLYHNYIYYSAQPSNICSIAEPCAQQYILGFGYVTIPMLALTALLLTGVLLIFKKVAKD